jgi:integrase
VANKKGATVHSYETNIRVHYLPAFGEMRLSLIFIESVQTFLNQKSIEGKAVQTIKNLKWGLSSIFVAAVKYGYMTSNPAQDTDLPPEQIRERKQFPTFDELSLLIERLQEPISTAAWLVAVSSVRPNELAFKWKDLDVEKRELWVVRAVNQGKLHTPKYHRTNRAIRLTEADVRRLLNLKSWKKAKDDDWMFPNRLKTGPIWHETLLARRVQPVAKELGSTHYMATSQALGATHMVETGVPVKAIQERLGHSRPDILLKYYVEVLDGSMEMAAAAMSARLLGGLSSGNPVET